MKYFAAYFHKGVEQSIWEGAYKRIKPPLKPLLTSDRPRVTVKLKAYAKITNLNLKRLTPRGMVTGLALNAAGHHSFELPAYSITPQILLGIC
jgi:hypothetical protein